MDLFIRDDDPDEVVVITDTSEVTDMGEGVMSEADVSSVSSEEVDEDDISDVDEATDGEGEAGSLKAGE